MRFVKNKYVVATFLVAIIYLIYLKLMQIVPFGEYSILKCDLYQQYINFFCYLREIILNGKSIIFSWNLGLANNFYTTFAYYLISPLNLLVVFFTPENMDIFVEIITFIKIALMANFFILFLEKSYKYKSIEVVIFGLIYAYSSYVICYSFHIMWLDCVYMLPIVLLFVDKYLENGKIWPFVLSLSYAILTNYYIGYIVAFFSGIYYLAKVFILEEKRIKRFAKFILGILISFAIGMIVILPSIMQLKGKMSADIELINIDKEKIKLFINVIFNNYVYMFTQKSCFMFSSTLTILLLPMYYLNKKINWREKLSFSCIILFLLLPIISPFLNKVWHCFTTPNCFNYRYSFTLIFTLILMATRQFQNRDYSKNWHFIVSLLVFLGLTGIEILFLKKGYLNSDGYTVSMGSIGVSVGVFFAMLVLVYILFLFNKNFINSSARPTIYKKIYYLLNLLLFLIVIFDLLIGAKSGQNNNDKYFKREIVTQYDSFMKYFMQKIESPQTQRIVFESDSYGSNMSLKYGYSNIGFFTSARNRDVLKAMYRLGYNVQMDEQLWITSFSGTFLNYSMAGVKYYVTKNKLEDNEIYGFEFDEKYEDYYIYKNKNAFKMGFYLKENIDESYNPFKMQNDFLKNLVNDINMESNNKKEAIEKNTNKEFFEDIENSNVLICDKTIKFNEENEEYTIKYKVKAKKDCNIYLASDNDLQVYINEKPQFNNYSNIWSTETGIKQIKYLKQNEEFEFEIKTKQNLELLYIYVSNNEEIQKLLDKREERNLFANIKINNNGLTGTAKFIDNGYLVFSINYDKCWKIYVDGKKVDTEAIIGTFLGVKLESGEHQIELVAGKY